MIRPTLNAAILVASSFALAACQQAETSNEKEETASADKGDVKWGYAEEDGPAKWGDLSDDFALCKTGKEQSPVDLPVADGAKTIQVSTNYASAEAEVLNNGHAVEAKFGEGFTLTSGNNTYGLIQFHYHTPSENTVAGKSFPLTAHFVHADADGNLAVLGVMFDEGEANEQVQATIDNVGGKTTLDLAAMLPDDKSVYNFKGSLTTPPCSEGVNWHVLTNPVTASGEQIEALNKIMGNNARPVQPLNDREI